MRSAAEKGATGSWRYECALCSAVATRAEKNGMSYCEAHWRAVHPLRFLRVAHSIRHTSTLSQR